MTTPTLPTLSLNTKQIELAEQLRAKLTKFRAKNREKSDLYDGKFETLGLDIAVPERLEGVIKAVAGWPGTVVDVLEERLEFLGWIGEYSDILNDLAKDNQLQVESGRGHLESLIYGTGFITVGAGIVADQEPEVLITVESTESCTVHWDYRGRRALAALSQTTDESGIVTMETLYLPNETIRFTRAVGGRMAVEHRDPHNLGRVPVARMINRDRPSDIAGRSEITRAVRYLTEAAVRTLVGMEVNREFYTSPKWAALNVEPEVFGMSDKQSKDANRRAGWSATQGQFNVIPIQEGPDGEPVEVKLHEFRPAPPTPYIDQVKAYSQMLSAESGIPSPYLGFVTDNPSSADAIRQEEYRLVKRAERRQTSFGLGWHEVGRLSLMFMKEYDPKKFREVSENWRDASTPTRAATADETVKYIGAKVLPPDSKVTWNRIGLSEADQKQLEADNRRSLVRDLVEQARARNAAPVTNDPATGGPPSPVADSRPADRDRRNDPA